MDDSLQIVNTNRELQRMKQPYRFLKSLTSLQPAKAICDLSEIYNNKAEHSIKPFVIRRKNILFANTPRGAQCSTIIYSLVETAKEKRLDPFKYLVHILATAKKVDLSQKDSVNLLVPKKCTS